MESENTKYVLDFVIPTGKMGATGSLGATGQVGPTGPTGPTALEDMIYVQYKDATASETFTIDTSTILPNNSPLYSISGKEIVINEVGNYEYTICGNIGENAYIGMQVIKQNGTAVNLLGVESKEKMILYSKTGLLRIDSKQNLRVLCILNQANTKVESMTIMVKRLPF